MIQIRSAIPALDSSRSLGVVAIALLTVVAACSNGDEDSTAAPAPAESSAVEAPAETTEPDTGDAADSDPDTGDAADSEPDTGDAADSEPDTGDAAALDFGSGTGSITLGDETFALAIGPGTGVCRDVFGIIQASGSVTDGRDIQGEFMIPPLDWETYSDGRYDPPSVDLEISSTGDDNARWRADAAWAEEIGKAGSSQVDSYAKDGLTASGTATFANAWNDEAASVRGSFEISCAAG